MRRRTVQNVYVPICIRQNDPDDRTNGIQNGRDGPNGAPNRPWTARGSEWVLLERSVREQVRPYAGSAKS